ncbi:hypothetical protein PR048_020025 [Dryococelus australis]|uniref:Uncharacterized protein n=1 Tax=Dryococelus australis TaxID=614101 RepID=A0ABQ9H588_9NEOP|nr:hypothetical protein PR048_020025 [Dryococelus australis]
MMERVKVLPEFEISNFPCHIQAVERCVQLLTEYPGKIYGQESKDAYITTTLLSRSAMPKFGQKSDFKPMPIV